MADSYIINVEGQQQDAVKRLKKSIKDTESELKPEILRASTPEKMEQDLKDMICFDHRDWRWNWPVTPDEESIDLQTGIYKHVYGAKNQLKVIACAVSHMRAWEQIIMNDQAAVIFESDALLTRKFTGMRKGLGCVGLCDPRGATRRAQVFHEEVSKSNSVKFAPYVNDPTGPNYAQGLAGGSAYWVEPHMAKEFLNKVKEVGMWPNDAFLCSANFLSLRVVYPYYTKVQGVESSTQG